MLDEARSAKAGVTGIVAAHIDWVLADRVSARILVAFRDSTAILCDDVDWRQVNRTAFGSLRAWITSDAC